MDGIGSKFLPDRTTEDRIMAVTQNRIIIGDQNSPVLTLDNECIRSVSGILTCNLVGEELPDDTIEAVLDAGGSLTNIVPMDYTDGLESSDGELLAVADDIASIYMQLPHGIPVWYFNGEHCIGEFYLQEIKRTGRTQFTLKAQSIIGVMDTHTYYGRMCNGEPLKEIVEHILLTNGMRSATTAAIRKMFDNLTWGPGADEIPVYGWLPVCSKRVALYHVLFAYGLTMIRAEDGTMMITYIFSSAPTKIPDALTYDGGSITIPDPAQRVEVVENSYQKAPSKYIDIFDNDGETTNGEYIVLFDKAPIQSFGGTTGSGTGLHIVATCPNAAIVTGAGVIRGVPYNHIKRTISKGASNADDGKTVKVDNAYMVTADTSDALLNKLWKYYTQRRETEMDIVYSGENLAGNYEYMNPYREMEQGYLSEVKLSASAKAKYTAKFISGYTPPADDGRLSEYAFLTGAGVWKVPEKVLQKENPIIRVVLIGGGTGGDSGLKGKDGAARTALGTFTTKRNAPGKDGNPGAPGKVYQFTIEGDALKSEYSYSCGHGGAGGDYCHSESTPNAGEPGSDTTFGEYSSGEGIRSDAGTKNLYTGKIYAKATSVGSRYGGGSGHKIDMDGRFGAYAGEWTVGAAAGGTRVYSGGNTDVSFSYFYWEADGRWAKWGACAGDPGGAGVGENGKNPGKPSMSGGTIRTGNGGNGGNSTLKCKSRMDYDHDAYGYGGYGGYGGGGGGDTGFVKTGWPFGLVAGTPGTGGYGGAGGDGCPGAIIIYY